MKTCDSTNSTCGPHDSLNRVKNSKTKTRSSIGCDEAKQNKNSSNNYEITSWRSETRQEVYRSNLLQALQQVRLGSGRGVREAADRVLAMTAKGRSRWSRAILTKHKSMKCNLRRRGVCPRLKKRRVGLKWKKSPAVQRKALVLRRLVPGCRKQPFSVVLEEVADYISALDMQVKVMAAVAELLSERSNSGSGFVAGDGDVNLTQVGSSPSSPSM